MRGCHMMKLKANIGCLWIVLGACACSNASPGTSSTQPTPYDGTWTTSIDGGTANSFEFVVKSNIITRFGYDIGASDSNANGSCSISTSASCPISATCAAESTFSINNGIFEIAYSFSDFGFDIRGTFTSDLSAAGTLSVDLTPNCGTGASTLEWTAQRASD